MIKNRLNEIEGKIKKAMSAAGRADIVNLMAVTKTRTAEEVNEAIAAGITLLGENRVQEFLSRVEQYNLAGVKIHFIGHLQTNKVKQIIEKVDMIESVDSIRLAEEINRQAENHGKIMEILLEVNIGREKSKNGFMPEEVEKSLETIEKMQNLRVRGLMCIPPVEKVCEFFQKMQGLFVDIKGKNVDNSNMSILSMGMSDDFEQAISFGTNIIRLGTAVFGNRN